MPATGRPAVMWEHAGRPHLWRPVTVTTRYAAGPALTTLPGLQLGRTPPRNVAIRRADGTTAVVPVRTLRRRLPDGATEQ